MLCPKCSGIDFASSPLQIEHPPDFYEWQPIPAEERPSDATGRFYAYAHYSDVGSLASSARQTGCHLCIQVLWALEQVGLVVDSPQNHHDGPVELRWYPHPEVLRPEAQTRQREVFAVARTGLRDIKTSFTFLQFGDRDVDSARSWVEDTGSLPALLQSKASSSSKLWSTGCDENFLLAAMWLRRCLSHHALCTISTLPDPTLPTRVLDIGTRSERGDGIRLVDGKGQRGRYVALSHVWGISRIITTQMSNIEERRKGITMESLSRTFRDAVHVARQLLVRYLWIDSLCIIQDSGKDWSVEAAKMGSYYANALFTISAVSSSGGHCGIFETCDPHGRSPCPISIRFREPNHGEDGSAVMGAAPCSLSGFIHPAFDWDPSLDTYQYIAHRPPLWQRAWVLQERLLSSRLLMFSKAQMSWLCRSARASECIPEGSLRKRDTSETEREMQEALLGFKRYSTSPSLSAENVEPDAMRRLYDAWYDLIAQYTKCGLTVKSDIFPAISGIASTLAYAIPDEEFVAGLWRSDLHRGLLWSAVDSTKRMPDLRRYRAPSWSWAALPGTCGFVVREMLLSDVDTSLMRIITVEMAVDRLNPFGEVRSGSICVLGRLKRAHPAGSDLESLGKVFLGIAEAPGTMDLYDLEAGVALGYYMADNQDRSNLTEVWCTPVLSSDTGSASQMWHCIAMVNLAADGEHRAMMRVGMAWIKDAHWFDEVQEEVFLIQ